MPPADTVEHARQLRERFGITRVADITGLDTLGVPVVSVIRPGSKMAYTVHSGKGSTAELAMASGLMEAIEVAVAETADERLPSRPASVRELEEGGVACLRPQDLFYRIPLDSYSDAATLPWVEGHDLIQGGPVWVPLELVNLVANDYRRILPPCTVDTHGLASGNTIEEAIFHGLSEIVERDACLLTVFLAADLDLVEAMPRRPRLIDLATLPPASAELAQRIAAAGFELFLVDLTTELGIPVVRALIQERVPPHFGGRHRNDGFVWYSGSGASVSPEVAIIRAITEAAQSRTVHIQGAREDLDIATSTARSVLVDDGEHYLFQAKKKIAISWMWHRGFRRLILDPGAQKEPFDAMDRYLADDVSLETRFVLDRLVEHGFGRAVVVDLSVPNTGVSVVKIIVPGLPFCVQSFAYPPRFYRFLL